MRYEELKNLWLEEEQYAFQGWDFSHLQARWQHGLLDWDYKSIVLEHLHSTDRLLDMGTGGGEFLLSLGHPYANTAVTEAWQPNIQLCNENLTPLGIQVYPVQDDIPMPIPDGSFDIVINRHEYYNLHEVSLANDSNYGLSGIVFAGSTERGLEVAKQIETGSVFVNSYGGTLPELPFGGVRRSGYGRELGGALGIESFMIKESVVVREKDIDLKDTFGGFVQK